MRLMMIVMAAAVVGCGRPEAPPPQTLARLAGDSAARQMDQNTAWFLAQMQQIRSRVPAWVDACAANIPRSNFRGPDATERRARAIEACARRDLDAAVARLQAEDDRRMAAVERRFDRDLALARDANVPARRVDPAPLGSGGNPVWVAPVPFSDIRLP